MGKFLFSQRGLWEPIRPVLWPFIIGFFWKVFPFSIIFFSRLVTLALSLASVYLLFLIVKHFFNKHTALLAAILFSFSSVFFFFTFCIYTEIPAVTHVDFAEAIVGAIWVRGVVSI